MKALAGNITVAFFVAALMLVLMRPGCSVPESHTVVRRTTDTIVIRDTVVLPPPAPQTVYVTRIDTVFILSGDLTDTTSSFALLPIERKEYSTADYRAVIEGYRAELLEMIVFPEKIFIENREVVTINKKHRWGLGIQAGMGFSRDRTGPYIGVGLQYNLWVF